MTREQLIAQTLLGSAKSHGGPEFLPIEVNNQKVQSQVSQVVCFCAAPLALVASARYAAAEGLMLWPGREWDFQKAAQGFSSAQAKLRDAA